MMDAKLDFDLLLTVTTLMHVKNYKILIKKTVFKKGIFKEPEKDAFMTLLKSYVILMYKYR